MRTARAILFVCLLFVLHSTAVAGTIRTFDITIDYFTPTVGPMEAFFDFVMFESPVNAWPSEPPFPPAIAERSTTLLPGIARWREVIEDDDLSDNYFMAWGEILYPEATVTLFVAEPHTGYVPDWMVWGWGPPWISMEDLLTTNAITGDLFIFAGYDTQPGTPHPWTVGTWTIAAVPEASSIFLFGTGLALMCGMLSHRKRRQ
ncbi:MAG: PEP-CTERM sorting domain-containing protein [Acidobacteria bacterium]|nr:PEP-CTERM sorting domain-containing protein [Acidobacteriota bacterium]